MRRLWARLWARLWEGFGDLPLPEDRPWFRTIDLPPRDTTPPHEGEHP